MALGTALIAASLLVGLGAGLLSTQLATGRAAFLVIALNICYWLGWGVLSIGVVALGRRYPLNQGRRLRALLVHATASVIVAFVHMVAFGVVSSVVRGWWTGSAAPLFPLSRGQFEWELTMYWACTGLAHLVASREHQRSSELRAARLEAELAQARLVALQRQIQPHFLFNTLHTLMAVMHRDVDTAAKLVEALGDVVRATLKADSEGMASLADEVEIARAYLMIEQINRGSKLHASIEVEPGIGGAIVPQLVLQPLVENAIRHGSSNRPEGARVRVEARRHDQRLEVSVIDNGLGVSTSTGGLGIAVANIRARLELIYGEDHSFELVAAPGGGTRASLAVPLRFASESSHEAARSHSRRSA